MPRLDDSTLALAPAHRAVLLALLRAYVPQAEVWAYGSRVTGTSHAGSDLDLVLRHPTDPAREVAGRGALQTALQESALPMLVEVHTWPQLPAPFQTEIARAYVVLQTP